MTWGNFALILLVGLCAAGAGGMASEAPPLSVEAALSMRKLNPDAVVDLSPDGKLAACALEDARRRPPEADPRYREFSRRGVPPEDIGCDVWLSDVGTGKSRNLTGGRGSSWGPAWSPDGERLAFYSDRDGAARLWVWERKSGRFRRVSGLLVRSWLPFDVPRWTPDGREVVYAAFPEGSDAEGVAARLFGPPKPSPDAKGPGVRVFAFDPAKTEAASSAPVAEPKRFRERAVFDVAAVEVASGRARRLVRNVSPVCWWVSPDGARVAVACHAGVSFQNGYQDLYDLVTVPLRGGGAARVAAPDVFLGNATTVSWSPDSKSLAWTTDGPEGDGNIHVVSADGGSPRPVMTAPHPDARASYRPPVWGADGRNFTFLNAEGVWEVGAGGGATRRIAALPGKQPLEIVGPGGGGRFWSPDGGRSLVVSARDIETKRIGFYQVGIETGAVSTLYEADRDFGFGHFLKLDVSADGGRVLFAAQDARTPPDLWAADAGFRDVRRASEFNPDLSGRANGEARMVAWKSRKGKDLRGALLLPTGYEAGKRYPLVVYPHRRLMGSNRIHQYGLSAYGGVENMQVLATRGYAVLLPDVPDEARFDGVRAYADAVLPAVDRLVEMGVADPARVGVMGHSDGGYGVLALVTQTNRFRAAVCRSGMANLFTLYGRLDQDGNGPHADIMEALYTGGTPWTARGKFIEQSPYFALDKVETPLLLIHGTLDGPQLADEVFVALSHLKKPVTYARYDGEHWEGRWDFANQLDYWNRVIAWFDTHLKPTAER